jgi:hypothetical protein
VQRLTDRALERRDVEPDDERQEERDPRQVERLPSADRTQGCRFDSRIMVPHAWTVALVDDPA